jgi:hypothetical protein
MRKDGSNDFRIPAVRAGSAGGDEWIEPEGDGIAERKVLDSTGVQLIRFAGRVVTGLDAG